MKIGILTFHGADNYGSVMQAYALSSYLKNRGHQAEIVDYYFEHDYRQYRVFRAYRYATHPQSFVADLIDIGPHMRRRKNFEAFRRDVLPLSKGKKLSLEQLKAAAKEYDCLICGSDQIWNLDCTGGVNDAYFLKFADAGVRKIAYAPSMGMDEAGEDVLRAIAREIEGFDAVALREQSSADMLAPYLSRKVGSVVDPTLLLNPSDYRELLDAAPVDKAQKYVLLYILGSTRGYGHVLDYAAELARSKGLKLKYIIDTNNGMRRLSGDNMSGCNPCTFLSLIQNAQFVVSNSFHATVFSILFRRKFVSFARGKSSRRMQDLLEKLGIPERMFDTGSSIDAEIDYDSVHEKIRTLRASSEEYLLNALEK